MPSTGTPALKTYSGARGLFSSVVLPDRRKDNPRWVEITDLLFGDIPRPKLAIHTDFTYTAGDKLGVLGTKVEDEDFMVVDVGHFFL